MDEEILGYIDWEGNLHKCSYGKHSILALSLARKLLKDDSYKSTHKINYGLVKISNSSVDECYFVYLPKILNEKQKLTLNNLMIETDNKHLKYAIIESLNKYDKNIVDKIDIMNETIFSCSKDEYDYGVIGSSTKFKYKGDYL